MRYIFWSKKEKEVGISKLDHLEREFDVYGAENLILRKDTKGLLDVYINLPQYIDISSDIYISVVGYAVFESPFGEFAKRIDAREIRVEPSMWRE